MSYARAANLGGSIVPPPASTPFAQQVAAGPPNASAAAHPQTIGQAHFDRALYGAPEPPAKGFSFTQPTGNKTELGQ